MQPSRQVGVLDVMMNGSLLVNMASKSTDWSQEQFKMVFQGKRCTFSGRMGEMLFTSSRYGE